VTGRDATPADAPALAALARATFAETFGHLYTPANLAAFLARHTADAWAQDLADPRLAVRLGEQDGTALAYAKLGPPSLPFEPRGPSIELRQFYVLRPAQGTGVAGELMEWVLAESRRRGAQDLYLSVFVDNHRARRFYARYGFEQVGTYAFKVGDHEDLDYVLRLSL
jgi:diamine N-acetyltransferase